MTYLHAVVTYPTGTLSAVYNYITSYLTYVLVIFKRNVEKKKVLTPQAVFIWRFFSCPPQGGAVASSKQYNTIRRTAGINTVHQAACVQKDNTDMLHIRSVITQLWFICTIPHIKNISQDERILSTACITQI